MKRAHKRFFKMLLSVVALFILIISVNPVSVVYAQSTTTAINNGGTTNAGTTDVSGTGNTDYNDIGITENNNNSTTVIRQPGTATSADDIKDINIGNNLNITYSDGKGELSGALRILIILTMVALAPTLLIMLTSFTRILVVLHFTRAAIGTQTAPPNQVLIGLTLFLTFSWKRVSSFLFTRFSLSFELKSKSFTCFFTALDVLVNESIQPKSR